MMTAISVPRPAAGDARPPEAARAAARRAAGQCRPWTRSLHSPGRLRCAVQSCAAPAAHAARGLRDVRHDTPASLALVSVSSRDGNPQLIDVTSARAQPATRCTASAVRPRARASSWPSSPPAANVTKAPSEVPITLFCRATSSARLTSSRTASNRSHRLASELSIRSSTVPGNATSGRTARGMPADAATARRT